MKIIIVRFVCSILVLVFFVSIIIHFYERKTYTITYDTYEYNSHIKNLELRNKDCKFTLTGYTEQEAVNDFIELEFLNDLCVGDSVAIIKVEQY